MSEGEGGELVEHFDPYDRNPFPTSDPRHMEREVAMQREARAVAEHRHPRGTKLRVADFWRLYYQHQGSVESPRSASGGGLTSRSATSPTAASASGGPEEENSRPRSITALKEEVEVADRLKQQEQIAKNASSAAAGGDQKELTEEEKQKKKEQEEEASGELNAPVPAGGAATCIGVVDGGLTILIGRENGRVAVVDGLKGQVVQDIDVALEARNRANPRRREVATALDTRKQDSKVCVAEAQEKAMVTRDLEGESTAKECVSCISSFTPRGLGRPMFLCGSDQGRIFLFDATTLTFLDQVNLKAESSVSEIRWLIEREGDRTEMMVRNHQGDLFVIEIHAVDTPSEEEIRNIDATLKVLKSRGCVPPKHEKNPPPRICSMTTLGGTTWVGDASGNIHTLDEQDLGRVQFGSEDFSLYAVTSDNDDPSVNALAVGGSFTYAAVENRIHVLPLSGMPKDRIPLCTLEAHKATVVSLDFDLATGRLWSRDASGFVACYDGTSKSGFALRTTMQLPLEQGAKICDIKFCSYETHVRLWTLASNGLNKQWCSGFAAGSTDATNQASLNEADIDCDASRYMHWCKVVEFENEVVNRRRQIGALALQEADRTASLSDFFDLWKRHVNVKKYQRIQPLHARMLVSTAERSLAGRTFRRWLQFRLGKRLHKIHEGGSRLLLNRVQEELALAMYRRWQRFVERKREQIRFKAVSVILCGASNRICSGNYYEKWKAFALGRQLKRQRAAMVHAIFERWQLAKMQTGFDTIRRFAAHKRAKKLAETSVGILQRRLDQIRAVFFFEQWTQFRTMRKQRTKRKLWVEAECKNNLSTISLKYFHLWQNLKLFRNSKNQEKTNEDLTNKVSVQHDKYSANQEHVDRVRLLKNLRDKLAATKEESKSLEKQISDSTEAAGGAHKELQATRDKFQEPKKRGTMISTSEKFARDVFGLGDPLHDAKVASGILKETESHNGKAAHHAAHQALDIIKRGNELLHKEKMDKYHEELKEFEAQQQKEKEQKEKEGASSTSSSSATAASSSPASSSSSPAVAPEKPNDLTPEELVAVPRFAGEIDSFGQKIGKEESITFCELVKKAAMCTLAVSNKNQASADEHFATTSSHHNTEASQWYVAEGDNLVQVAKRWILVPPVPPPVVKPPRTTSPRGKRAPGGKTTARRTGSSSGARTSTGGGSKRAASSGKTAHAKPAAKTPAGKRPALKRPH